VRKPAPERTAPQRDYWQALGAPGISEGQASGIGDDVQGIIAEGVRAAYAVFDEYLREGQRLASEIVDQVGDAAAATISGVGSGRTTTMLGGVLEEWFGGRRVGGAAKASMVPIIELSGQPGGLALGHAVVHDVADLSPPTVDLLEPAAVTRTEAAVVHEDALVVALAIAIDQVSGTHYGIVRGAGQRVLAVVMLHVLADGVHEATSGRP
jgi:hypothetical protein